jgi:hypothetical protein
VSGADWAPTTAAQWIADQERTTRERGRGGAVRKPWFKIYKTSPFNWLQSGAFVIWDQAVEGDPSGWAYDAATGAFTCLAAGTYTFDSRMAASTTVTFCNTAWVVNGVDVEGYNGGSLSYAITSHGAPFKRFFSQGDIVRLRIFSGTTNAGSTVDVSRKLCWITCELNSY